MNILKLLILVGVLCHLATAAHPLLAATPGEVDTGTQTDPVKKTLVWPDGTRYVGGVADGKRTGRGTIFWQDGTRFVGQFKNDMRNGPGTMILPDGTVYTGFFKDDELVDTEETLAASNSAGPPELDEATTTAMNETEVPIEADSLSVPAESMTPPVQVDENDLLATAPVDPYPNAVEAVTEPVTPAVPANSKEQVAASPVSPPASRPVEAPVEVEAPVNADKETSQTQVTRAEASEVKPTVSIPANSTQANPTQANSIQAVTEITDDVKDSLINAVDRWAGAWADQNVKDYLTYYARDFQVPGNQSRRTWEGLRRTRLTSPSFINIDIAYESFQLAEPNIVDVSFRQTYRSNSYSDVTRKTLRMKRQGTDWKILAERSR